MKTRTVALWFLGAATAVATYLWLTRHTLARLLLSLGFGAVPLHDYFYFFYPMGRKVLTDPRPIEGFLYSPWAALFFAPLGKLPYLLSAWCWASVLLVFVALLAYETARFAPANSTLASASIVAVCSTFPVLNALKFGQVSLLLVVALLACARLYGQGHRGAAAACLAFAASFKLYPVLFLSYFVLKRDRRFILLCAGLMLCALCIVPVGLFGVSSTWTFYANVSSQIQQRFGAGITDSNSQSLQSLMARVLFRHHTLAELPLRPALTAFRYLLCLSFLVPVYRCAKARGSDATDEAFMWLFLSTPFFVATSWPNYFVYLPAVATFAIGRAPRRERHGIYAWLTVATALCSVILSNILFYDLVGNRHVYADLGVLFVANLCAAAAVGMASRAAYLERGRRLVPTMDRLS